MSIQLISSKLNIDFLGKKYFALVLSTCLIAASIYIWIDRGEAKFGIDYRGGHEIIVKTEDGLDWILGLPSTSCARRYVASAAS